MDRENDLFASRFESNVGLVSAFTRLYAGGHILNPCAALGNINDDNLILTDERLASTTTIRQVNKLILGREAID